MHVPNSVHVICYYSKTKGSVFVSRVLLRDKTGKIIGDLKTEPNGNKVLRDGSGYILGYYIKSMNLTKDYRGYIVGQGDVLSMLLK